MKPAPPPGEPLSDADERALAAYMRMAWLSRAPVATVVGIPVIGTLLGQALRVVFAPALFTTARHDALSGVSNARLFWATALAFGTLALWLGVFGLYGAMAEALPPARVWVAQAAVAVFVVLGLPYLIEAAGLWMGTIGHAAGRADKALHSRLNRFHRPTRNLFSPRTQRGEAP